MKKLILTGFEPFGPYKFNPTQDIAKAFSGADYFGIKIIGIVLPASYFSASDILFSKIERERPDIVLSCGLASSVQRIRIEAVGRNCMNGKYPDCDGLKPRNEEIVLGGPRCQSVNTDSIALANCLHDEGIDSEVSVDAGAYICNSLIYRTMYRIRDKKSQIKFAFFHTPWTDKDLDRIQLEQGKVTIKKSDLVKTVEILAQKIGGE